MRERFPDQERKKVGEAIYRAMYEHKGGSWAANETKDAWYATADRFFRLISIDTDTSGRAM